MGKCIDEEIEDSVDRSFLEGVDIILDSGLSRHATCLELRLLVLEIYGTEEVDGDPESLC